jgi:spoIIIJ-associated protein
MTDQELFESPKQHLEKMLTIMEIEGSVEEERTDESTTVYRISCSDDDAKLLIGRKGQTLEALQFLLRQMCRSAQTPDEEHFVLDILDYRQRRQEAIVDRAKRAAVAVLNGEHEEYALPPMSAYERRIVHNYLHESFPDLESRSLGEGPDRHIVISYAGLPNGEETSSEETAT